MQEIFQHHLSVKKYVLCCIMLDGTQLDPTPPTTAHYYPLLPPSTTTIQIILCQLFTEIDDWKFYRGENMKIFVSL